MVISKNSMQGHKLMPTLLAVTCRIIAAVHMDVHDYPGILMLTHTSVSLRALLKHGNGGRLVTRAQCTTQ